MPTHCALLVCASCPHSDRSEESINVVWNKAFGEFVCIFGCVYINEQAVKHVAYWPAVALQNWLLCLFMRRWTTGRIGRVLNLNDFDVVVVIAVWHCGMPFLNATPIYVCSCLCLCVCVSAFRPIGVFWYLICLGTRPCNPVSFARTSLLYICIYICLRRNICCHCATQPTANAFNKCMPGDNNNKATFMA